MTTPLRRKRGETLRLTLEHAIDGAAVDLTGYTITCAARTSGDATDGTPMATASVTILDQVTLTGRFTVDFDLTTGWPIGRVAIDAKLVSGDTVYTPTVTVDIERPVTP